MKIIVNGIPPSNNQFIGRTNYREYQAKKQMWHWLIKAKIKERPKQPYKKSVVKLTYFFKDRRRRDPDNYSGKMILDALTKEGIIQDDSFYNIELVLHAQVDRLNPRTEIEIEEKR